MMGLVCPNCGTKIEKPLRIKEERLLIVEGRDEEEFFGALLEKLKINEIQVLGIGGKSLLKDRLKALKIDSHWKKVSSLGIMRDADQNPEGAFQSVCSALKNAGLPVPKKVMEPTNRNIKPVICAMIIPSYSRPGALESLCLDAAKDEPAMTCVEEYFVCLKRQGVANVKSVNLHKARARVYLASKEEPDLSIGIAAKKGYWPLDSSVFDEVKRFIELIKR